MSSFAESASSPGGQSNFGINYKPTEIDFELSLIRVYENKLGHSLNLLCDESRTLNNYFIIQMISENQFIPEIYTNITFPNNSEDKYVNEKFMETYLRFVIYLMQNNPDWGKLMYLITQINPSFRFKVSLNCFNRKITSDIIHQHKSLFTSLTYLEPVVFTPEFSFTPLDI